MLRWFKRFYRSKENLSKNEIDEMMENNDNIVLLDVRSPQEFNEWHMPKAINIPTYEIFEKIQKIIKDKNTIIICYCTFGIRSKKAIKMLKKLGYTNLYHLDGGI